MQQKYFLNHVRKVTKSQFIFIRGKVKTILRSKVTNGFLMCNPKFHHLRLPVKQSHSKRFYVSFATFVGKLLNKITQ